MGVPGERQGDIRGHARKHVRTVAEEDARPRRRAHPRERAGEIVVAGEGIVDAANRQRTDPPGIVVENGDADPFELAADRSGIPPVIVIAQHRDGAQPGLEASQRSDRVSSGIVTGRRPLVADEVAGDQDQVGVERVDLRDDPTQPTGRHVRPRHVNVRDEDQPKRRGQAFNADRSRSNERIGGGHMVHPAEHRRPDQEQYQGSAFDARAFPAELVTHARFLAASR